MSEFYNITAGLNEFAIIWDFWDGTTNFINWKIRSVLILRAKSFELRVYGVISIQ